MYINEKALFQDQTDIIHSISSGVPLKEILESIVKNIERYCHPVKLSASIMLYNPTFKRLEETVSSSLPQNYINAIQPLNIGPYEGSCGTAAFLKHPVFVSDIENDSLWDKYRHITDSFGFRSCWSTPILSSKKELLGTFALYFEEISQPNKEIKKILDFYSHLSVIAIEFTKTIKNNRNNNMLHSFEAKKTMINANEIILSDLYRALDKEEFEVYFQPYFGVEKKVVGMEALIRWNHPHSGVISPASFLGIAEETGFILEIEKWVLAQSILKVKQLHLSGLKELRLSVNISAQQFENPDFPEMVYNLLQQLAFTPENLTLEITERFLIKEDNIEVINRLKQSGIRISIDDFGVSYSSLQYLKDLTIDELKIDRSFICNIETDRNSQKIVETIISLGHHLNLNIVAEGVETEQQFQLLKNMKCDIVQGYLFSKPLPFDRLEKKKFISDRMLQDEYVLQRN